MGRCFAAIVVAAQLTVIYGKSDGTIPSSACVSMLPGHGHSPQTTETLYHVDVESVYFVQNIFLRVYLEAPATAAPFKGFYCQARTDANTVVGEFKVDANHSLGHSCDPQQGIINAVSHSSSWSKKPGRRVMLRWRVTTPLLKSVRIRCTFVQDYSTFWVGVESVEIGPIQNTTYEECCDEELIPSQCAPLCKNISEPAGKDAINILNSIIYGDPIVDDDDDDDELHLENATCYYEDVRLALRCSYWSQPGFYLDSSIVRDCCGDGVTDECKVFCNKNLYAAMNYLETNYTYCLSAYPWILSCIIQPVQGSLLDVTSLPITMDEFTTESSGVTLSTPISPSTPAELPGHTVFTITITVRVNGATQNPTLRRNVFQALENDLIIPALAKVLGYVEVRTGVGYYEGSLVVSSEGVYQQQSDGSVPSTNDVKLELDNRLGEISNIITRGSDAWTVSRPVDVTHKAINQQCGSVSCNDGATCVEVGPAGTTCVCESDSCNAAGSGLSTGALIGIIVGVVLFFIIVGVILYVLRRRGSLHATKKDKKHRTSAKSNHAYEDPVYMDISSVVPKPPKLPPDRSGGNLPSNSVTYETPADDTNGGQVQSFRKISEGYVVGVTEENTENDSKNTGGYGYTAYDVNGSTAKKPESDRDYDDHHLKTGDYGYAAYDVNGSTVKKAESDHAYDDRHLKTETTGFTAAPVENIANKQNVARYESLSGYEHAVDPVRL